MPAQTSLFGDEPPLPGRIGVAEVRARYGSHLLHKPAGSLKDFDYSLNPYIGCGFGCSYCFAAAFVADKERRENWGKWVDVKLGAEAELSRKYLRGKRIFMSSATDPYQPLELKIGLTRRIVEILVEKQPYLVIQTRSPIVTRDIDLFRQFKKIRVNMSITTDCDSVRKRFEPSCASIDRRIEALRELVSAGIPVGVSVAPMLPIVDPEAFAKKLVAIGVSSGFAAVFHRTDREFTSNTREPALVAAREYGWTDDKAYLAAKRMQQFLPSLHVWNRRK